MVVLSLGVVRFWFFLRQSSGNILWFGLMCLDLLIFLSLLVLSISLIFCSSVLMCFCAVAQFDFACSCVLSFLCAISDAGY